MKRRRDTLGWPFWPRHCDLHNAVNVTESRSLGLRAMQAVGFGYTSSPMSIIINKKPNCW